MASAYPLGVPACETAPTMVRTGRGRSLHPKITLIEYFITNAIIKDFHLLRPRQPCGQGANESTIAKRDPSIDSDGGTIGCIRGPQA